MYGLLSRSIRVIFFRIVQGAFSTCGSLHMHSTCAICYTGFTNFCNIKTSCCNHSSHTYSKTNLSVLLFLYFVLSPALTWRANVNLVPIKTLSVHQLLRPCSFNIEQWYPKCQIVQTDICSLFWTQGPNELLHFFCKNKNKLMLTNPCGALLDIYSVNILISLHLLQLPQSLVHAEHCCSRFSEWRHLAYHGRAV